METCIKTVLRSPTGKNPNVCTLIVAKSCYADRTTTKILTD